MTPIKYALIASLVATFGLSASPAMAKGGKSKAKASTPAAKTKATTQRSSAPASPAKAKNYDFLADEIDGSRVMPDDTTIFGREDLSHRSLIRLRTQFIAEILKSAEML